MTIKSAPLTLPAVFPADLSYRLGAALFGLVGIVGIGLAASRHQTQNLIVMCIPFAVFLSVLLLTLTFRLEVDEAGLRQRSLFGRKDAAWDSVRRVDQGKAYSIYGEGDRELVWLSLVTTAAQIAVAEEAIRRCGLRPSGAKLEYPVRRQWVRE